MPISYDDLGASANGLFNDHHNAGSLNFSQKGQVGSGGATYELNASNAVSGGPIEWNCEVTADWLKINHDHAGNISKSLDFAVKQVPGLNVNWSPAFNKDSGMNLGNLKVNYANKKANVNVDMALSKPDNADFDVTVAPCNNCPETILGLKGNLSASGLNNASYAFQTAKDGMTASFEGTDLKNPMQGKGSFYKALNNNKNFCCYGIEATTSGSLAVAAATGCCKSGYRYKLDNTGRFSVTRLSPINRAVNLALSAEMNMTSLSAGGHKFGASFSFE